MLKFPIFIVPKGMVAKMLKRYGKVRRDLEELKPGPGRLYFDGWLIPTERSELRFLSGSRDKIRGPDLRMIPGYATGGSRQ